MSKITENASKAKLEDSDTRDQSTHKNRRIEIFFRNRYISIGNNVSMKEKINQYNTKQHSKMIGGTGSLRKGSQPPTPTSIKLL